MTIKTDMNRLQYRKGGLLKLLLKKGDTLFSIARDNELSIAELLEANPQIKNPDEIYAGDNLFIPSKGKAPVVKEPSKQESFLSVFRKKAKEVARKFKRDDIKLPETSEPELRKRILPINMRQLAYDVFGGDDDLTETDLSPAEYAAAREIAINAKKRQSDTIAYEDYQTVPKGMQSVYDDPAYADVGGSIKGSQGVIKKSFNDPKYALKTTIGQARLTTNDKGETILEDQYNFNEKSWKDRSFSIEGVKTFLGDMSNVLKQPEYFGPRMLGSYLGSGPGEGSMVKINLGKLEY
jgi:LysM repeat protein